MSINKNKQTKYINLNERWRAFYSGTAFGWCLECLQHEQKSLPYRQAISCSCEVDEETWKKLLFLDELWRI